MAVSQDIHLPGGVETKDREPLFRCSCANPSEVRSFILVVTNDDFDGGAGVLIAQFRNVEPIFFKDGFSYTTARVFRPLPTLAKYGGVGQATLLGLDFEMWVTVGQECRTDTLVTAVLAPSLEAYIGA